MGLMHRSTPCIGVCSTTYGDLVCRGCKRFAHEIVGWNGFAESQRNTVWQRLEELRDGALERFVEVTDAQLLRSCAARMRVPQLDEQSDVRVAYEVLIRGNYPLVELDALGLQVRSLGLGLTSSGALVRLVDKEFFQRSRAHYERNYRIAAE